MGEAVAGETSLSGRSSPRRPRRFPRGYINTLSDGAQSATSLLAKSLPQRPLFFTMCFWMKFRAPKLDSQYSRLPILIPLKNSRCCTSFLIHEILTVIRSWQREAMTAVTFFFNRSRTRGGRSYPTEFFQH